MTRREAVGVLVLIAVAIAAGLIDRDTSHATPAPAIHTTAAVDVEQQISDATDGLHAVQTAINSQPVTHQPLERLLADCWDRVNAYNITAIWAGRDWPTYLDHPLNPSKECQP